MKTTQTTLIFFLAIACLAIASDSANADFWSDLRDSIVGKNELTKTPKVETVVFRNLTTERIFLATASNHGLIDGWKIIEAGREIEVAFRVGQFHFTANDSNGNQYNFSAPVTMLPSTNYAFELRFTKDKTCTAIVEGKNRGTYRREYLGESGFRDRPYYQFPTSANTITFDKPAVNPQQNLKPPVQQPLEIKPQFSGGKPRFKIAYNGGETVFVLQPNGTCDAWEKGNKLVLQTVGNAGGVVTLRYNEKNTLFQIRGQSLYLLTPGSTNWQYVVDGQWRND